MADLPYAIIVTGDGELMEHKLANHNGRQHCCIHIVEDDTYPVCKVYEHFKCRVQGLG
jgi:hypothetical protein